MAWILGLSLAFVVSLATAALAQYPPTNPPGGAPAAPPAAPAQTGVDLTLGLVVLVALVVVGTAFLLVRQPRRQEA
jgi:hypothetical protein